MTPGLISVDDHVQEPPDLWTARLSPSRWGDRIPKLLPAGDGSEHWMVDGQELVEGRVARAGALMADRNHEPASWAEVPPAAYVPAERLKAMDAAGVDCSVLYPTVAGSAGEAFARLDDEELEHACVRAYNDWLVEEWGAASERFIPQCIVPVWPTEATVAEIRRAVSIGHRGVVFPVGVMDFRQVAHIADPDWDPVWSVCEELDVPLCLHAGSSPELQYAPPPGLAPARAEALKAMTRPVSSAYILNLFLFSRILMRHPRLRVIFAESALSWATLDLEWADHEADHDGLVNEGYDLTPSQLFHRQCYLNAWYEPVAGFLPFIGAQNILWSANIPQTSSTWPNVGETIDRCFLQVSTEDRERVLSKNAAKLYRL
jgi:predicted TIM-barrel fold metal-dependent hydrolase